MTSRRTGFTRWLIVLFASAALIAAAAGCGGPPVTLGFPLDDGASWTYQGTTTYKIAGQEETMPALSFILSARRLSPIAPAPFDLAMNEHGDRIMDLQLVASPKGLLNPLTGEIWLPQKIEVGRKWSVTVQGNKVKMTLHSLAQTTAPAGTFSAYQITFRGPRSDYGSFWLDPDVGIVSLTWVSRSSGAEATTQLELASYNLP